MAWFIQLTFRCHLKTLVAQNLTQQAILKAALLGHILRREIYLLVLSLGLNVRQINGFSPDRLHRRQEERRSERTPAELIRN